MAISCLSDINCAEYEICKDLTCTHKDLFPDVLPIEIGAFFLVFIFSIITTVAGIGGGVVFLPILMIMFNFTPQEAAPISITMVFLILLLRNILSVRQRHPLRDKPVINYEIALVFSPSNIIGNKYIWSYNKCGISNMVNINFFDSYYGCKCLCDRQKSY